MVVTCPSCSARYRLNPDKMKGRGAKITCPKCAHVFVVFADGASGSATGGESGVESLPSTAALEEDTLKQRLLRRDRSTTSGALHALGLEGDMDAGQTSSKIRVVAPGPRGSRKAVATLDTSQSIPSISAAGEEGEGESEEAWEGPEIIDANQLDFREVGISTWKVKVAIGLVYDFSDIATLKRYLDDKKVTQADLISHNGKDWTTIGDIPDLDRHFIETWKAARADRKGKPVEKPKKKAEGTGLETGSFQTSTGRMGALSPSGRHETVRSRPRRKKKAPAPKKKSAPTGVMVFAAILVIGGLAWYLMRPPAMSGGGGSASAGPSPSSRIDDQDEQDRIRKGVKHEVERQREKMMQEERAAFAEEEAAAEGEGTTEGEVDLTRLEAVRPGEQTTTVVTPPAGAGTRLPPPNPVAGRRMPPPSAAGSRSTGTTSVQKDQGGSMWLAQGRRALASGNNGTARSMFEKCVTKNDKAGECWAGLGQSLQRMGEAKLAAEAFDRAQALGVKVNRSAP